MKRVINMLSILLTFAFIVSCTDEVDDNENNLTSAISDLQFEENILNVPNRETLKDLIDHGNSALTRINGAPSFLSLMDEIPANAPLLDSLTIEERDTILTEHLTFYEVLGFKDLIPNENFARLINPLGEIIVNDTIYRVTQYGTAYAPIAYRQELDIAIKGLRSNSGLFENGENIVPLTSHVYLINSFDHEVFLTDDDSLTGGGTGSGTGGGSGTGNINTPLSDIPFSSFPTFSSSSHTFVGNAIDWLLGERHTRHHEFINGYRVGGLLYDYNYGVYQECGTLVKMEKKRGGLFRLINGWKNINANELVIHFDKMALKKSGSNPDYMFDNYGNPSYKGFGDFNSSWKHVFITAKNWSDQDVANIFADGVNNAIARLSTATNATIPPAARSFMIMTKNACYRYMYDVTKYANNDEKLRMVFDSGVNIVLYYDSEKTIVANIYNNLKNLLTNRDFDIIDGQVKLAGRLNSNWGGMIINKD